MHCRAQKTLINLNDTLLSSSEEKVKDTYDENQFKLEIEKLTINKKTLENTLKEKDEAISLLTAKNNSLEDTNINLNAKIVDLQKNQTLCEDRIKTCCLTITQMSGELKPLKSSDSDTVNKLKQEVAKPSKITDEKQKGLKIALGNLKKKESAEKDIQSDFNLKNKQIIDLENENTRLKLMFEQAKDSAYPSQSSPRESVSNSVPNVIPEPRKCSYENTGW